jgi:muramoyltetrapeptide carboxypeptidase LdcA involved in peptidoglycan recycling
MPKLKDAVLFIEDDDTAGDLTFGEFYRNLHSLMQQPHADSIKGILIGRFYSKSEMTAEKMRFIAKSDPRLKKIPIIANVDFGHTDPTITFPVGGTVEISARKNKAEIKIITH